MRTLECPKCTSRMDEGYLLEHNQSGYAPVAWISDPPEKSFWAGVKLKGHAKIPVRTFRCRSCGYLESYARGD